MVISSDIEGRLRIRDECLRNSSAAETIHGILAAHPEVYLCSVNTRAGSLLVLYNHSIGVRKEILNLICSFLPCGEREAAGIFNRSMRLPLPFPAVSARRLTNMGMMVSLALSLLGAALDLKRFHVISGILFVGVLGFHLSSKKRLLPS